MMCEMDIADLPRASSVAFVDQWTVRNNLVVLETKAEVQQSNTCLAANCARFELFKSTYTDSTLSQSLILGLLEGNDQSNLPMGLHGVWRSTTANRPR
jgi:hypothetical protein